MRFKQTFYVHLMQFLMPEPVDVGHWKLSICTVHTRLKEKKVMAAFHDL